MLSSMIGSGRNAPGIAYGDGLVVVEAFSGRDVEEPR